MVPAEVHPYLDQGPNVLVLNRTLASDFVKPSSVGPISHGLVLQIALASLITDRAVQRVIGKQELHDTLSCLGY